MSVKEYLTIPEVEVKTGISKTWLYRNIREGNISTVKMDRECASGRHLKVMMIFKDDVERIVQLYHQQLEQKKGLRIPFDTTDELPRVDAEGPPLKFDYNLLLC